MAVVDALVVVLALVVVMASAVVDSLVAVVLVVIIVAVVDASVVVGWLSLSRLCAQWCWCSRGDLGHVGCVQC